MSQLFHTPRKMRQRNRTTVSHLYKSSTPYKNVAMKHYSISLSEIGTGSSSSAGEIKKKPRSQITEKRKRNAVKKKRAVTRLTDSDSEWETRSVESVKRTSIELQSRGSKSKNSHEECQGDVPVCCKLFEDPCTPEKVRDAPIEYEPLFESPVLQSSRRLRLIPAKNNNLEQCDDSLPIPSLQFSKSQNVNLEEADDDTPIFHREKDIKTYPAPPKLKESPEWRPKNFTFHVRFPTETSDLLWDEFVNKFHDEVCQYLASPSKRAPMKLTDSMRGLPNVSYSKRRIDPLPSGMKCISRRYNRVTGEWITCSESEIANEFERENFERQNKPKTDRRETKVRTRKTRKRKRKETTWKSMQKQKVDVYDQSDETDIEFETGGRDKRRISFRKFCHKQRINKAKISSHSDTQ